MKKSIVCGSDAVYLIKSGADTLSRVLKGTAGPCGRNAVIQDSGKVSVLNDGAAISANILLPDSIEKAGAELLKEATAKTGNAVGDGVTITALIANSVISESLKKIAAGANSVFVRKGIEKACEKALQLLPDYVYPVNDKKLLRSIAIVASGDEIIGETVSDAVWQLGPDALYSVEDSPTAETYTELIDGMTFGKGFISPYMATDRKNMETVFEDAAIFCTDRKISVTKDILGVLEPLKHINKPLLIICDELEGEALNTISINCMKGNLKVCVVRAPGYQGNRDALLEDIACVTGASVVSPEIGVELKDANTDYVGLAKKVIVNANRTTIFGGSGDKEEIKHRAELIRAQLPSCTIPEKEIMLKGRIASLIGGCAYIRVGAPTKALREEMKHRAQNAISASRTALLSGVAEGGGVVYLKLSEKLTEFSRSLKGDERYGAECVAEALKAPFASICANAGYDHSVFLDKIKKSKAGLTGFDAETGELCNVIDRGIADPAETVTQAISNACSVAGLLISGEAVTIDKT